MKKGRHKVYIHCNRCGERFILRGSKKGKGKLGTGFMRCLCNNESDFQIRSEEIQDLL